MISKFFLLAGTSAVVLVLGAGVGGASQLVVVEARGVALTPGTTLDGSKPLSLQDGQGVTLLASTGQIVKLDGPSNATPDSQVTPISGGEANAVTALLSQQQARTSDVGVVRGETEVKLPSPFVVDVTHPGTSCVPEGQPVILWRSGDLSQTRVAISPADRSWTVSGMWPAQADQLQMPANLPLHDRTSYVIDLGGKLAPVTLRLIPDAVSSNVMRASWMSQVGCDTQAAALLDSLKPKG